MFDFRTLGLFCLILAIICAGLSFYWYYRYQKSLAFSAVAEARVVSIETIPVTGNQNRTRYHHHQYAVLEYFAQGKLVESKSHEVVYPCPYQVGERFLISYDPEDPVRYEIISTHRWEIFSLIFRAISIGAVALGAVCYLLFASVV